MNDLEKDEEGIELDKLDLSIIQQPKPSIEEEKKAPLVEKSLQLNKDRIQSDEASQKAPPFMQRVSTFVIPIVIVILALLSVLFFLWQHEVGKYYFYKKFSISESSKSQIDDLTQSIDQLYKSIKKIEILSKNINTRSIDVTKVTIEKTKTLMDQFTDEQNDFSKLIDKEERTLHMNGYGILIDIEKSYHHEDYVNYLQNLEGYLGNVYSYIRYYQKHYDAIINQKQPQLTTHETFYTRYKNSQKEYESAKRHYIMYLTQMLESHPSALRFFLYRKDASFFSF